MVILHSLDQGVVDFIELWIVGREFVEFHAESDDALKGNSIVVLRFHGGGLNALVRPDHDRGNEYVVANHTLNVSVDPELFLLNRVKFHKYVLYVTG